MAAFYTVQLPTSWNFTYKWWLVWHLVTPVSCGRVAQQGTTNFQVVHRGTFQTFWEQLPPLEKFNGVFWGSTWSSFIVFVCSYLRGEECHIFMTSVSLPHSLSLRGWLWLSWGANSLFPHLSCTHSLLSCWSPLKIEFVIILYPEWVSLQVITVLNIQAPQISRPPFGLQMAFRLPI